LVYSPELVVPHGPECCLDEEPLAGQVNRIGDKPIHTANVMAMRRFVASDRVLRRPRRQVFAGNDADPNRRVVPFVRNYHVMWLHLSDEAPNHLGRAFAGSWRALPVFLFECGQDLVFAVKVSVI
jgi:hypothetical protein